MAPAIRGKDLLMAEIPKPSDTTVSRIWADWEKRAERRHSRRLGASQIGKPCDRALWYSFRWAKTPSFPGRMYRLFQTGHLEEYKIGEELKRIGIDFKAVDEETGEQYEFTAVGDHFVCKLDGAAAGFPEAPATWHVVEMKTSNEENWKKMQKDGIQKAKPEYYAQVQIGMGLSGMDRAAFIAVNKNTDDIYFERVKFDKVEYGRLIQRAREIIFSITAPDRISESPAWFQCKFCDYHEVCHGSAFAEKNCRTCCRSMPLEDGGWACDKTNTVIDMDKQKAGCEHHGYREGMRPPEVEKIVKNAERIFKNAAS